MIWFNGSIPEAVAQAKRDGKLFLVYIEGTDDMSKTMTSTYNDTSVTERLSSEDVIALKLSANSVPYLQFCAIYPVLVIPSSYFIGVNGSPIEVVTGSLSPPEFSSKIDKVLEIHRNSLGVKKEKSEVVSEPSSSKQSTSTSLGNAEAAPSTSQTSDNEDTKPPLDERVERAKTLIEEQRLKKLAEEQEKEKRSEIERRNIGKAVQQAEQRRQDLELKEWAKNRAKEKEEERLAREKVKAMIAQDRAERAAKYQQMKEAQSEQENLARIQREQEEAARIAAINSNDARIQFRLPDGSYTNHLFSADATLNEARQFVINVVRPPFSNFSLCTTFPRRHFTENNYSETLRDLQLAPSAVLLILPCQAVTSAGRSGSFITNLFWLLLSPITSLWNMLISLFPGSSQSSNTSASNEVPSNAESAEASEGENPRSQSVHKRRGESGFYKREGNIFRINNQSDDDENNTWNGNSTQQM